MNRRYIPPLAVVVAGVGAAIWAILVPGVAAEVTLAIGSAAVPLAVLMAVAVKTGLRPPWRAVFGGGFVGGAVALVSHGIVFAFAYAFLLGLAEAAVDLFEAVRIDPRVTSAAGSPWTIVLAVELVVVAPLTEELGKVLGSRVAGVGDRRFAFLAGVAAGSGFAIIENILYASSAGFFGESWQFVVIARTLGGAVHPLATGLVALAWWDWRNTRDSSTGLRGFLAGLGVHAVWNGSLVILGVLSTAFDLGEAPQSYVITTLSYSAAIGVAFAALLWRVSESVTAESVGLVAFDVREGKLLGAWILLSASLLLPVAMLLLGVVPS